MSTVNRPRGVTVYPMPERVTGPFERYAVVFREVGGVTEARMVHSEGVSYLVTDDKPWVWNDYADDCPSYSVNDLRLVVLGGPDGVDLADWVRTFGARLESNFHQIHQWATEPGQENGS
jgi:hypothetical protein